MQNFEEILRLVKEANNRTARIQTLSDKINTTHEHTFDDYDTNLLSAHLKIAINHLQAAQEVASYLSRPVKETSRLWKNGRGQYETTAGFCFREGSPIEVLVPDKYYPGRSHWERTYLRYDGKEYYLDNHTELSLNGLPVRVREGDQP